MLGTCHVHQCRSLWLSQAGHSRVTERVALRGGFIMRGDRDQQSSPIPDQDMIFRQRMMLMLPCKQCQYAFRTLSAKIRQRHCETTSIHTIDGIQFCGRHLLFATLKPAASMQLWLLCKECQVNFYVALGPSQAHSLCSCTSMSALQGVQMLHPWSAHNDKAAGFDAMTAYMRRPQLGFLTSCYYYSESFNTDLILHQ